MRFESSCVHFSFDSESAFDAAYQSSALASDWMQGLLLSVMVVGVFLAVSALRDYLVRMDVNHGDGFAGQQLPLQPAQVSLLTRGSLELLR